MTAREKTIAICVGAAVGLLALDQFLLSPYFDRLSAADSRIAEHQAVLADAQTVQQTRLRATRKWKELSSGLVTADASSAERQLTNRLSEYAKRANLDLGSAKADKSDKEKGFDRYGDKRTTTGNMQQIARFLYEVQTTDIPIRLNELTITSRKDGVDDLTLALSLATIYQPTNAARPAVADAGSNP